jgi:regulator of replication initiation timing
MLFWFIGICEMQRTNTRERVDALVRESKRIKISIDQLKEKLSKRRVNLPFPQKETNDFESR